MEPQNDDINLGDVDLEFGQHYQKGVQQGSNQAAQLQHTDYYKSGMEYGRKVLNVLKKWGLQFGYQMGFIDYLKDLMKQSENKLLKNNKVVDIVSELQAIFLTTNVEECSVQEINESRQLTNKKFKILLNLLKVKNHESTIEQDSLDF